MDSKVRVHRVKMDFSGLLWKYKWWPDSESNQGHDDFQSSALPTELSGHL